MLRGRKDHVGSFVLLNLNSENEEVRAMRDIVFVACSFCFFLVAIVYVWGCERLK
jgi:hypothetical protein